MPWLRDLPSGWMQTPFSDGIGDESTQRGWMTHVAATNVYDVPVSPVSKDAGRTTGGSIIDSDCTAARAELTNK
jgi:hypothetical protein